jgi:hypothetical protein
MGHAARLQLVARVTYYLGWIMIFLGGLVQMNVAKPMILAMSLTKRNLFEGSVMLFLICLASQVRASGAEGK